MKIDSTEEISTDLLNENDTQPSPSNSIKRNEDYIHEEAILKSPLFSAPEEFNDAKIGLKVMKENSPNKIIPTLLGIKLKLYNFPSIEIQTLFYSRKQNWMIHFLQHNLC